MKTFFAVTLIAFLITPAISNASLPEPIDPPETFKVVEWCKPDSEPVARVVFINGIWNTQSEAVSSRDELLTKFGRRFSAWSLGCIEFTLGYNHHDGYLADLFDSFLQVAGQSETTTAFWRYMRGVRTFLPSSVESFLDSRIESIAGTVQALHDVESLLSDQDLREFRNLATEFTSQGKPVVMVGHSQGSLYTNQVHRLSLSSDRDLLANILVATPAAKVEGPLPHVTIFLDVILGVPGALPANTENVLSLVAPWSIHQFVSSYMKNWQSSTTITDAMLDFLAGHLPSKKFQHGDFVEVSFDIPLRVIDLEADGDPKPVMGERKRGDKGVIVDGPVLYRTWHWKVAFAGSVTGWVTEDGLRKQEGVRVSLTNNETCQEYGVCAVVLDIDDWVDSSSIVVEIEWGDGTTLSSQTLADCVNVGACQHLGNGRYRAWKVYSEAGEGAYPVRVRYGAFGEEPVVESFFANVTATKALGLTATPGDARVELSWANLGADRYNVCRATQPVAEFDSCSVYAGGTLLLDVGTPPRGFEGLTNGTTYHFRVEAKFGKERLISQGASATPVAVVAPPAGGGLNDTGITFCGEALDGNNDPCRGFEPWGQDAHFGRDAAALAGALNKVGGGSAGFDFTKIANNGAELPASATLGSGPNDWACTRDNVTGLIWEVKVDDPTHLRHKDHTYTWYDPDSPDDNPGTANGGLCVGSACDTSGFVNDVNTSGLCGSIEWRMPTRSELQGIVDYGQVEPSIDLAYFPNTPSYFFWSSSVRPPAAWSVYFFHGDVTSIYGKSFRLLVRLVRHGS